MFWPFIGIQLGFFAVAVAASSVGGSPVPGRVAAGRPRARRSVRRYRACGAAARLAADQRPRCAAPQPGGTGAAGVAPYLRRGPAGASVPARPPAWPAGPVTKVLCGDPIPKPTCLAPVQELRATRGRRTAPWPRWTVSLDDLMRLGGLLQQMRASCLAAREPAPAAHAVPAERRRPGSARGRRSHGQVNGTSGRCDDRARSTGRGVRPAASGPLARSPDRSARSAPAQPYDCLTWPEPPRGHPPAGRGLVVMFAIDGSGSVHGPGGTDPRGAQERRLPVRR